MRMFYVETQKLSTEVPGIIACKKVGTPAVVSLPF